MSSAALTYQKKRNRDHQKDSPEAVQAEIDRWCKLYPDYRRIVSDIRVELHGMASVRDRKSSLASIGS